MSIKINSHILLEETKKKMIDAISKTVRSKTEHGFRLCADKDNYIRHGNLCEGRKCYIETVEFECKKDEKPIGIFHTHPTTGLNPSSSDLSMGYLDGMNCIGSYEGIRCFRRKREDFDALEYADIKRMGSKENFLKWELERLKNREITYNDYKEEFEEYREEMNKLIDSYFRIINIK